MNDKDGSGALWERRHPAYLAAIALGGSWMRTQWQLILLSLWRVSKKREMRISGKVSNLGGEMKKKEGPENLAKTREEKPLGMCRIADEVFTGEWWKNLIMSAQWAGKSTSRLKRGRNSPWNKGSKNAKWAQCILKRVFSVQYGEAKEKHCSRVHGWRGTDSLFSDLQNICFFSHPPPKDKISFQV